MLKVHDAMPLPTEVPTLLPEQVKVPDNIEAPAVEPFRGVLAEISKGDTLDVYAQRMRGTTALGSRALLLVGLPTITESMFVASGGQALAVPILAGVGGATASGLRYWYKRAHESAKAKKAEANQDVIRERLGGNVDVVRVKAPVTKTVKQRHRGDQLSLHWSPLDKDASAGKVVDSLSKTAAFAEKYGVADIAVPAGILPATGKLAATEPDMQKRVITTAAYFEQTKGIRIDDKLNPEKLVRLTPAELASIVAEQIKAKVSKTESLGDWMIKLQSEHPMLETYLKWKELGKPEDMRAQLAKIVGGSLERKFGSETMGGWQKIPVYGSSNNVEGFQRIRTESNVKVTASGVRFFTTPNMRSTDGHPAPVSYEDKTWEQVVGRPMKKFIDGPDRKSKFADERKEAPGLLELLAQNAELPENEKWKVEVALYYVLNHPDEQIDLIGMGLASTNNAATGRSIYSRLTHERPRSKPFWPGLHHRGAISKEGQTLVYGRMFWRNMGQKAGAIAVAVGIMGGLGVGWGETWLYEDRAGYCEAGQNPSWMADNPEDLKLTPAQVELCASLEYAAADFVGDGAVHVSHFNGVVEKRALIEAYQSGLLTEENAADLFGAISEDWVQKKRSDLEERFNLYGGDRSDIGDVTGYDEGNPAVWSLKASNGASTEGYWPTHVLDKILIDNRSPESSMPPYKGRSLSFEGSDHKMALFGTKLTDSIDYGPVSQDVTYFREVALQDNVDTSKPLITVAGRFLTSATDLESIINNEFGATDMFSTLALPVLENASVVSAKIVVKDLRNDKILLTPDIRVIQRDDGTFRVILPRDIPTGYLDIEYVVDPAQATKLPVRAVRPLVAGQPGEPSQPLSDIVTPSQTVALRHRLNLPENATAAERSLAVASTRSYSFVPYEESKTVATIKTESTNSIPTGEMLVKIAETAEGMDLANCNLAETIGIVATGGRDGTDGFTNAVTGFREDGDGVLSKVESHVWNTNDEAIRNDGTPPDTRGTVKKPEVKPYAESPKPSKDRLRQGVNGLMSMLVLGGGVLLGRRLTPPAVHLNNRRRQRADRRFVDNHALELGILKYLKYAPGASIDDKNLPASVTAMPAVTTDQRILTIPQLTAKEVDALVVQKTAQGAQISPKTQRTLRRLVARGARLRQS